MLTAVSANVNGVRAAARRGGLAWLAALDPDVLCLQEVRCDDAQLLAVLAEGHFSALNVAHAPAAAAGRAGVAVLSRTVPVATRIGLPGFEDAGRWIEADLHTADGLLTVISSYVPTGEADTDKQVEKYAFLDAMNERMGALAERSRAGGGEAILTGDLNIAHREVDLKNWKGNRGKAGFLPEEQAYLTKWFSSGWTDLGRQHGGEGPGPYTWWSWRGKAFDNDAGWRIDYMVATDALATRAVKVEVGRAASYAERWSDHAAVTTWFN